ncbi:unnamed protein product [Amoebophrya sp. A120]|nr:unnamed protein product [Amoebophrya sp. A120]|eukprot:GSA120T00021558001.1
MTRAIELLPPTPPQQDLLCVHTLNGCEKGVTKPTSRRSFSSASFLSSARKCVTRGGASIVCGSSKAGRPTASAQVVSAAASSAARGETTESGREEKREDLVRSSVPDRLESSSSREINLLKRASFDFDLLYAKSGGLGDSVLHLTQVHLHQMAAAGGHAGPYANQGGRASPDSVFRHSKFGWLLRRIREDKFHVVRAQELENLVQRRYKQQYSASSSGHDDRAAVDKEIEVAKKFWEGPLAVRRRNLQKGPPKGGGAATKNQGASQGHESIVVVPSEVQLGIVDHAHSSSSSYNPAPRGEMNYKAEQQELTTPPGETTNTSAPPLPEEFRAALDEDPLCRQFSFLLHAVNAARGDTPLHEAARSGNWAALQLLIGFDDLSTIEQLEDVKSDPSGAARPAVSISSTGRSGSTSLTRTLVLEEKQRDLHLEQAPSRDHLESRNHVARQDGGHPRRGGPHDRRLYAEPDLENPFSGSNHPETTRWVWRQLLFKKNAFGDTAGDLLKPHVTRSRLFTERQLLSQLSRILDQKRPDPTFVRL